MIGEYYRECDSEYGREGICKMKSTVGTYGEVRLRDGMVIYPNSTCELQNVQW